MVDTIGRWFLTGVVAVALVGGTSGATLRAQNAPERNEPRPGSRADQIEDKQEAQAASVENLRRQGKAEIGPSAVRTSKPRGDRRPRAAPA